MNDRILHIIYIEDNPNNMLLVGRILNAEGHVMMIAENGHRGIKLAHEKRPDMIFVDLMLPDIDGFEVIRNIRTNPKLKKTPVVVLTALHDPATERRAREVGCDAFIRKPVNVHSIRKMISSFFMAPAFI